MTLTGCINVAYHCDWHTAKPELQMQGKPLFLGVHKSLVLVHAPLNTILSTKKHVFHFASGPFLWLPLSLPTNASQLRNCPLASARLLPYVLTI